MTGNIRTNPEVLHKVVLQGRPGQPEEMAKMVAFLLSEDSSFTTGSVYVADGGFSL